MKHTASRIRWIWILLAVLALTATAGRARAGAGIGGDEDIRTLNQEADQKGQATGSASKDATPTMTEMIVKMTLALGIVFGLMAGAVWAARRWMPRSVGSLHSGPIQVLGTRSLGQRRSLLLVRARDKTVLLGVTPQSIAFLTDVDMEPSAWQEAAIQAELHQADFASGNAGTTGLEREP